VSAAGEVHGSRRRAAMLPVYRYNPYQRLLAAALEEHGIDVRLVDSWPARAPLLGAWWTSGRPETLHLHWVQEFMGGWAGKPRRRTVLWLDWQLRLLRLLRVRLVWTAHNLRSHGGADAQSELEAHRRLVARVHAVIVHCEAARRALVEEYALPAAQQAKVHVVPHGSYVHHYEVERDRGADRRALGLPEQGRVLAFVGAIRAYKGAGDLLEAFMSIRDASPDVRLLLCGQPLPRRIGRELEARAAGDERIILRLERLPEEDLSRVLGAADAVVLPFRDILTSGSAILAMSHGRAVIAPRMGCLPETLPDDAAILYDPGAPDGLEDALAAALRADLAAMGVRAREVAESLEWGPIAGLTAKLYRG
jgi:beta-1,4-mannosyltransferase